ncbi:hypothetical protein NLG97_g3308 [Lecanicillium saksenae]|uniref:Uncharacterized protein n=1 Tax=Lecanicillium saksenae TaxID=468837 RepID=A0ACC1R151_9HYPO|nr:hypothetical protein NLG97_g3308 [Lecanicillium saksenae]
MLSKISALASVLALAATHVAGTPTLAPRSPAICYEGETPALHCYSGGDDTPQNVDVADIQYVATYLRRYGRKNPRKPAFYTLNAADTADCAEWSLYSRGTVLALIKHINPNVNSSVLYEDIATTIDGGEKATPAQQAASLIGCMTDGGSEGVLVNTTNPAYSTDEYKTAGYTPDGVLIKIVHSAS